MVRVNPEVVVQFELRQWFGLYGIDSISEIEDAWLGNRMLQFA